jgi:hypothetical protein
MNLWGQLHGAILDLMHWEQDSLSAKWGAFGLGIQLIVIGLLIMIV